MASQDLEAVVRGLLDREAIRELPLKYCQYIWNKDAPALVDLFTEDGTYGDSKGRAGLVEVYTRACTSPLNPHPFIHSHVFEMHGPDRATGNCHLDLRITVDGKSILAAGHYDDEYAKVDGTWKFRSRRTTFYFFVPLLEGWAEQDDMLKSVQNR